MGTNNGKAQSRMAPDQTSLPFLYRYPSSSSGIPSTLVTGISSQVSPVILAGDLKGFPPLLLIVGDNELFRDECRISSL